MHLFRHGEIGRERPGIFVDGIHYDLGGKVPDFSREGISIAALEAIAKIDVKALPVLEEGFRFGAVVTDPPNFYCIGLNYAQHAKETGSSLPVEPLLFNKAVNALAGPNDDFVLDPHITKLDWEVELGLVIGEPCYQIGVGDALSKVGGYFCANDLSEREFQKDRGGQFVKGKSLPGAGPIGPYLVTADEIPDPSALQIETLLNGAVVQSSQTSDMIFGVAEIISNLSQYLRLDVGDIILTGTPEGVGLGRTPPVFLKHGDVLTTRVEGLGAQVKRFLRP